MSWEWKNGNTKLVTASKYPAALNLTAGYRLDPITVPRIEPATSFRTLGVYFSPSGCQKQQYQKLRNHTQQYFNAVSASSLTPAEAYLSYFLYLCPKLIHPLPCSMLSRSQCRSVQAPALAGLLPKLHMNRHTPRSVLFAGLRFGGLNLPEAYLDQGYGQLSRRSPKIRG